MNKDDMIDIVQHDLQEARWFHDTQVDTVAKWIDEYNGESYGNEVQGRSSLVWKLIKKQGESLISNIAKPFMGNYDIVSLDPITDADVYKTKINEKLINHFWRKEFNPVNFIKTVSRVAVQEGTAFIRVGWDYDYRERRQTIPLEAFTEEMAQRLGSRGAEFLDNADGTITIIVRRIIKNAPTAKVVKTEDIYFDPTAERWEDVKYLIYEMRVSPSDIKADAIYDDAAVKKLLKIVEQNDDKYTSGSDIHNYNETDATFKDKPRKKIKLYEYWGYYDMDDDGHVEPVVCTMAQYGDDNVILRMEKNPFPFAKIPFVCIPLYETPYKIYGRALADVISDEQKLSTSITRGIIDNMAESNNGTKFFKKGALDSVNYNRLKRHEKYVEINTTGSVNTAIQDGNFNQLPASVYTMLGMLDQQAEALTGISKMMQGIPGSEIKSSTSNFSAMMSQSQIRLLDVTTNITSGLKDMFRMWVSMSTKYLDNPEIERITGLDIPQLKQMETQRLAQEFGIENLPEDTAMKAMMLVADEVNDMFDRTDLKYDIKMKIGTDGLKQIKVQNINMLIQQAGPLIQTGAVPPEAIKLLIADLSEQLDRPDVAQMILQYQPPGPSQEEQQAAQLQLAQMEANVQKDKALAANAMARTQNVAAKTQTETASLGANVANKYADVNKKMSEVDQKDAELGIKAHEAGTKRQQANKPQGGNS